MNKHSMENPNLLEQLGLPNKPIPGMIVVEVFWNGDYGFTSFEEIEDTIMDLILWGHKHIPQDHLKAWYFVEVHRKGAEYRDILKGES